MINIVRQIQYLESGKMKLELIPLNLKDRVDISCGMLNNLLDDKDISIDVDIPPDLVVEAADIKSTIIYDDYMRVPLSI